jgi:hypothetical protein
MKAAAAFVVLLTAASSPAYGGAPESVSGMVYRDSGGIPSLRTISARTIVFEPGGRFITLMDESENLNDPRTDDSGRIVIKSAQSDGDYEYTKIDDSTAAIDLQFDGGGSETLNLHFTTDYEGQTGAPGSGVSFAFTKVEDFENAPGTSISTRGHVAPGHPMIVGFVVPRPPDPDSMVRREVLVRVVGPSLAGLGVSDVWADPDFEIVRLGNAPNGRIPSIYGDWTTLQYRPYGGDFVADPNPEGAEGMRKIFDFVSAFELTDGSKDAVDFIRLGPGAYTVVTSMAPNDPGGEALVEVYFLP